jgi:hypothetical protein
MSAHSRARVIPASISMRFSYNYRTDHFSSAFFLALVMHLLVIALLPELPKLVMQGFERSPSLTVFLKHMEEQKKFQQSLNQQLPLPANTDTLADPSLGSTSIENGKDTIVSEAVEASRASSDQAQDADSIGSGANGDNSPTIRFDYTTVRLFAQQEAIRYADLHPKDVDRFARTFNRTRNYRRRSRSESYRDKLGDLYARSNSSAGDVCFKQKRETEAEELVTNTVYFFRCDKQPQGFELDLSKSAKG